MQGFSLWVICGQIVSRLLLLLEKTGAESKTITGCLSDSKKCRKKVKIRAKSGNCLDIVHHYMLWCTIRWKTAKLLGKKELDKRFLRMQPVLCLIPHYAVLRIKN